MKITLKSWAEREGINPATARQKANRGTIPAEKIGRDWFINENFKNTDLRVKSGKYKNWRQNNKTD